MKSFPRQTIRCPRHGPRSAEARPKNAAPLRFRSGVDRSGTNREPAASSSSRARSRRQTLPSSANPIASAALSATGPDANSWPPSWTIWSSNGSVTMRDSRTSPCAPASKRSRCAAVLRRCQLIHVSCRVRAVTRVHARPASYGRSKARVSRWSGGSRPCGPPPIRTRRVHDPAASEGYRTRTSIGHRRSSAVTIGRACLEGVVAAEAQITERAEHQPHAVAGLERSTAAPPRRKSSRLAERVLELRVVAVEENVRPNCDMLLGGRSGRSARHTTQ